MKIVDIKDLIKNLTPEEIEWFDKVHIPGGFANIKRPDLERGLLLYSLCKEMKAKRALDIGTAGFYSARAMAKYGCIVDTIDTEGEKDPKDGWDNIIFHKGRSQDIIPTLGDYDVCFIDGDHFYEGVKKDIELCMKKCKVIVCHDYINEAQVTRAIDEVIKPTEMIIEDRLWFGAPYENGIDRSGQPIDYGLVIWRDK